MDNSPCRGRDSQRRRASEARLPKIRHENIHTNQRLASARCGLCGRQRSARPVLARLWSCRRRAGPLLCRWLRTRRAAARAARGASPAWSARSPRCSSRASRPARSSGEISGFSRAASGHCYFTLKDPGGSATLRCAMFRRAAALLAFAPADGQRGRAARAPLGLRAARRAAVHHRGDAGRRRRARCTSASCACGRGSTPRACSTPPRSDRCRATRARSASSPRSPARRCTTSRRRWRDARRTSASSSTRALVQGSDAPAALCAAIAVGRCAQRGRRADRLPRRRLARGPVGVQRRARRARDPGGADARRERRRPRDRRDPRRPRRRPARADADRRRRARRAGDARRCSRRSTRLEPLLARAPRDDARDAGAAPRPAGAAPGAAERERRPARATSSICWRSGWRRRRGRRWPPAARAATPPRAGARHALAIARARLAGRLDAAAVRLHALDPERVLGRGYALLIGADGKPITTRRPAGRRQPRRGAPRRRRGRARDHRRSARGRPGTELARGECEASCLQSSIDPHALSRGLSWNTLCPRFRTPRTRSRRTSARRRSSTTTASTTRPTSTT